MLVDVVIAYSTIPGLPTLGEVWSLNKRTLHKLRGSPTVCICRYLQEPELYAFSHGLSYTAFEYRNLRLTSSSNAVDPNEFVAQVEVHNTGL